ncbi:NAD-dependent epimerase/dehydratase family protein [Streptomyces niger]|uniref:NAD-dependent epimerase/dehydratase family protein n=1 Tax=Streptomyces niger TaxID=66373 RepID=UPI00069ACB52|nr:NAD-dependent epimerase/dehydratase family protein [Streptomyces niger]
MRLLVTGRAGFTGSPFLRALLSATPVSAPRAVTVLDPSAGRGPAGPPPFAGRACVDHVPGDVHDGPLVQELMRHHELVVHLAEEPEAARTGSDLPGTRTLLRSAVHAGVTRFVYVYDHYRALRLTLDGGAAGQVHDLGDGAELTAAELTGRLLAECGRSGGAR